VGHAGRKAGRHAPGGGGPDRDPDLAERAHGREGPLRQQGRDPLAHRVTGPGDTIRLHIAPIGLPAERPSAGRAGQRGTEGQSRLEYGMNKVVARYQDGHVLKGTTNDFLPNKDLFHLTSADVAPGTRPAEVRLADLKAVFFVRDLSGHPEHKKTNEFDPSKA